MRVVVDGGTRPQVGDPVDVLATFDPQAVGSSEPTLVVARGVIVVAVDDGGSGSAPSDSASGGNVGVTMLVSPDEAKRLAFSAAAGTLAIAIAPPEDARVPSRP